MNVNLLTLILVGSFVAAASSYVGSIMVLKRMSLVGDALSHVALPGMGIAISMGVSPILGAFAALTLAVFGIWYLEETSDVYPETLVGVFFTTSLALGMILTEKSELLEALFGSIEKMTSPEAVFSIIISIFVIIITSFLIKKLVVSIISDDLAKVIDRKEEIINLAYLLLVGAIVSLGIRFVGTLLMGALVIVPAASAKNLAKSLSGYYISSMIFGILSAVLGIILAVYTGYLIGPMVVLVSVFVYLLTYFFKKAFM